MKKNLLFIAALFVVGLQLTSCDSSDEPQSQIVVPKEVDNECCDDIPRIYVPQ